MSIKRRGNRTIHREPKSSTTKVLIPKTRYEMKAMYKKLREDSEKSIIECVEAVAEHFQVTYKQAHETIEV